MRQSWWSLSVRRYTSKNAQKIPEKKKKVKKKLQLPVPHSPPPDFGSGPQKPVWKGRDGKVIEMLMLLFPKEK